MRENFDNFMDSSKGILKELLSPLKSAFDIFSNPWISFLIILGVFSALACFCGFVRKDKLKSHLKNPYVLAICALMIALNIVLGYCSINYSAYLKIRFGFMTQPVVAMLFGPLVACLTGIIQDAVSLALMPTGPFNPAYSLCVGISAMIYGLVFYKKPVSILRVLLAEVLVIFLGNIILNSIALSPTVGSGFIGILPARILKNIILLPIQTAVVYIVLKFVKKSNIFKNV